VDNSKLSIRKACLDDVNKINEILLKSFEPYREDFSIKAFEEAAISCEEIKMRISHCDSDIFVIILNNQIVGTISLIFKVWLLILFFRKEVLVVLF